MRVERSRTTFAGICVFASLLATVPPAAGQQAGALDPANGPASAPQDEFHSLLKSLSDLQTRVDTLTSQLSEVRAEEERQRAETEELRRRLSEKIETTSLRTLSTRSIEAVPNAPESVADAASAPGSDEPGRSLEERVGQLEENQQLTEQSLKEQNQTKVESGSKYRLRLSGIVLVNLFANRGPVDNQDFPEIATRRQPIDSTDAFGGSLRQSQVSLEGFGPEVAGARTSANLTFDFAGGFPAAPNGISMGILRLRTGFIRLEKGNTSLVIGQDSLFFAPLSPTSLASLAVPALAYSGNLWNWAPQLRVEHRIVFSEDSSFLLQAGILDQLSGEAPRSSFARSPTWGEESGQPGVALRTAWTGRAFGQAVTVGSAGYYGRQYWGFGRNVDSWAGLLDVSLPLGRLFEFSGAFYRGRAVGGLGGGIGQDILLTGTFTSTATRIYGLDSMGGWAQLKFKPKINFEINAALGEDSPFAGELRQFPASEAFYHNSAVYSSYDALLARNLTPFVNFIFAPKSNVSFSVEYRRILTSELDLSFHQANHMSLDVGYTF